MKVVCVGLLADVPTVSVSGLVWSGLAGDGAGLLIMMMMMMIIIIMGRVGGGS